MAKRDKPIRCKYNEVVGSFPGSGANGSLTEIYIECGNCGFGFTNIYTMAELSVGFPHEVCENCSTLNYVPYTISGRNDVR